MPVLYYSLLSADGLMAAVLDGKYTSVIKYNPTVSPKAVLMSQSQLEAVVSPIQHSEYYYVYVCVGGGGGGGRGCVCVWGGGGGRKGRGWLCVCVCVSPISL